MSVINSGGAVSLAAHGWTVLGGDGTPIGEAPEQTADRSARLADALAGQVEALHKLVQAQGTVLQQLGSEPQRDDLTATARELSDRVRTSLAILADALGHQHYELDELANRLGGRSTEGRWAA